jgi:predicted nucleic acid-binding protein
MLGFDANVLVYAADGSEGVKHVRCWQIVASALASERAFIPAQALAEFVWVRTHKQRRPLPETMEFADTWRALSRVAGYDDRDVAVAAETAHGHTLMFWDALIWAVCDRVGVLHLVSEDFQDGRRLGGVTFLSPFNPANAARLGLPSP